MPPELQNEGPEAVRNEKPASPGSSIALTSTPTTVGSDYVYGTGTATTLTFSGGPWVENSANNFTLTVGNSTGTSSGGNITISPGSATFTGGTFEINSRDNPEYWTRFRNG